MEPSNANFHWHRALALLHFGNYREGYAAYEWRLALPQLRNAPTPNPHKRWQHHDITDKTLLLTTEQGYGDTLQFCRYIPYVRQHAKKIIVLAKQPVAKLLSAMCAIDEVVVEQEAYPNQEIPIATHYDYHLPLMSIPNYFNLADCIDDTPLPDIDLSRCTSSPPLKNEGKPKIGLVWAGKPLPKDRSIPFHLLEPLIQRDDINYYSFQIDKQRYKLADYDWAEPIHCLADHISCFADMAMLMQQMDLMISIDSGPAHLAGTLNIPTWTLLLYYSDWRWQTHQNKTALYPKMMLFRQPQPFDWQSVITQLVQQLDIAMKKK